MSRQELGQGGREIGVTFHEPGPCVRGNRQRGCGSRTAARTLRPDADAPGADLELHQDSGRPAGGGEVGVVHRADTLRARDPVNRRYLLLDQGGKLIRQLTSRAVAELFKLPYGPADRRWPA